MRKDNNNNSNKNAFARVYVIVTQLVCVCVCDCGCVYARMSNEPSSLLLLTNAPFPLAHSLNTAGHLWNLGTLEYVLLTLASVTL